jgi:hypothetical protein
MLLADLSMLLGSQKTGPPQKEVRRSLTSISRRQPPELDFRRFNTHIVCQNVAGLWLKYGVKSAKIAVFWRPKNKLHDATIC